MRDEEIKVHVFQEKDRTNLSMRYVDPVTGRQVKRTTGSARRKEAAKRAAQWEADVNAGRYQRRQTISWDEFRERLEDEKLSAPSIADATRRAYASALDNLEQVISPDKLAKVNTETISRLANALRKQRTVIKDGRKITRRPLKESSIHTHLRHIKAAMNWAVKMGLMNQAPSFDMPKAGESKGRPITTEEFERMLAAVTKVRPHDPGVWTRILYGLWLCGLRMEEAYILAWTSDESPFALDMSGTFPAFKIKAKGQKARRAETVPLTPDFATWILNTPEEDRVGHVFSVPSLRDGSRLSSRHVGVIISEIGEAAGIVVSREIKEVVEPVPTTGKPTGQDRLVEKEVLKYASAHDLRRSFGTRWARKVMPAVLKKLMRHSDIGTTMKYYVDLDADEVAAGLWKGFSGQEGTISGTMPPNSPQTHGQEHH